MVYLDDDFMNIFHKRMCMCDEASKVLGMIFYFAINQHIIVEELLGEDI